MKRHNHKNEAIAILLLILGIWFGKWVEKPVRYYNIIAPSEMHWQEKGGIYAGEATPEELRQLPPEGIENYIRWKFGKDAEMALKIAYCESRFHSNSIGGVGERGLFQIHPIHTRRIEKLGWTFDDMFNPYRNTDLAYILFKEQGWEPWSCWRIVREVK